MNYHKIFEVEFVKITSTNYTCRHDSPKVNKLYIRDNRTIISDKRSVFIQTKK